MNKPDIDEIEGAECASDLYDIAKRFAAYARELEAERDKLKAFCDGLNEPCVCDVGETPTSLAARYKAERDEAEEIARKHAEGEAAAMALCINHEGHIETLAKERDDLRARLEEAVSVLGEVEWGAWIVKQSGEIVDFCPSCEQFASEGHTPECRLAAVLRDNEEKP